MSVFNSRNARPTVVVFTLIALQACAATVERPISGEPEVIRCADVAMTSKSQQCEVLATGSRGLVIVGTILAMFQSMNLPNQRACWSARVASSRQASSILMITFSSRTNGQARLRLSERNIDISGDLDWPDATRLLMRRQR